MQHSARVEALTAVPLVLLLLLASLCGQVVPLPLALPAPQQGPQGAQQGQQDGLGTLEYAPQWGWYTPIANTASEVASLPGRPLQSNAPVSTQQYTGGSQTAQPIPSSGPQYTGQQYTGGSRPGPLEQVPGGGQQYSGQPYVGQQYTGQQYTGGSRPILPELLPAGSAASPYPVDSRPVQQQRYPGLQYPPPYSTVDQPTVTVGYRGSSWTSSTASPGQLAAAEPQQDSGGVGAALVDLLRSKAALLGSAVRGGVRAVLWLPGVLLDALRGAPPRPGP